MTGRSAVFVRWVQDASLAALSMPQPAATSMPRRWRKVQGKPASSRMRWNSWPVSDALPA
ncbi:MAG: hypothetical protein ACQCXQ_08830 [Verrucomicrobiales bacterium]